MTAKLRIDLAQGLVDVEGSEELVRDIYDDVKERLHGVKSTHFVGQDGEKTGEMTGSKSAGEEPAKPDSGRTGVKGRNAGRAKESHSIIGDLDLSSNGGKPSLKDFYAQYKVSNNYERNTLFVYYLTNHGMVGQITNDHVFTCYRNVGAKLPEAFNQSLWDTGSKTGWIAAKPLDNIKITNAGINHVEHDIARS